MTSASPEGAPIPARRPNILLITADQWRGDLMGPHRPFGSLTPHLDALAAAGTRFASHYCQAYPCGPSRASLYTGLYAHKHRSVANGMPLDARHPTLFTELRRAGYLPTLFGYTDTTLDPRGRAARDPDCGTYENLCPGIAAGLVLTERATPWLAHLKAQGYRVDDPDAGREAIFAQRGFGEPAIFSAEHSETAFLTDRFLDWLGVVGAAPFCAHLSYIAPHPPFGAADPWHRLVDPADMPEPVRGADPAVEAAQSPLVAALIGQIGLTGHLIGLAGRAADMDRSLIRRMRAIYAGLAHEVDHHLGRIFRALRENGLWDNTLIVFTGDHGEQLGDHWLLGKTGYYDQSAHIPLIIRDPRPSADKGRGKLLESFTESVDVLPTLLEAAGVPTPRNCDGRSLLPLCAGEEIPADWRDEVHWSFHFGDIVGRRMEQALGLPTPRSHLQVVRAKHLKYIGFAGLPPVVFDLSADPDELANRASDPGSASLRLEGAERLLGFRQRHEEETLTGFLAKDGQLHQEGR
ncbi:alkaline phosphatase family protein [Ancylobacter oerskovii]|uniref:Alkaline phosphatase family protein n=1 Tax=Ancylobacter oerskovii TaxID=459519 RepID=A0ABW4YSY5_9HYPH|nr:alkaline phosphatase family protein [Ancylobacter oerskovii]MBS7543491.1 alkaline phosphatase family protein [Ancylobacter oerskovii]